MNRVNVIALIIATIILIMVLVGIWIDSMTTSEKLYTTGVVSLAYLFLSAVFINDDN